jgi:hypothetical protein
VTSDFSVPIRVLIYGSCVSRDILAYRSPLQSKFQLIDYYSRSSLASLTATPFVVPLSANVDSIASPFQKKMVERDMLKTFFDDIGVLQFDVLLMDLIDERFNLWVGENDQVCTISAELSQSGFVTENHGRVELSGSEAFWKRWESGWHIFVKNISRFNVLSRLIINKVFWSTAIEDGSSFQGAFSLKHIRDANEMLERMYQRIEEDVPTLKIINFPKHCLMAAEKHKWGVSPFHYVESYYEFAQRELIKYSSISQVKKNVSNTEKAVFSRREDPLDIVLANYSVWRTHLYNIIDVDDFIAKTEFIDGIHRIHCGSVTLDILVHGFHDICSLQLRQCLVCFGDAVSNRAGGRPPYFSGRGVAGELKLPFVSVSDPSFNLSETLALGWYAGHGDKPDLAKMIASILDRIAVCYGFRLILLGGSGGGFAALAQSCLLTCEFSAVVWNPQTSIGEYVPGAVLQYLKVAFPILSGEVDTILALPLSDQKQHLPQLLQRTGVFHSLVNVPRSKTARILYLQNRHDWHVNAHAKPYLGQDGWRRLGSTTFAQGETLAMHLGDWGAGHAAPPISFVTRLIADVVSGLSVIDIATELAESSTQDGYWPWLSVDMPGNDLKPMFHCAIADGLLRITVEVPLLPSAIGLEYAVYLIKGREKKKVFWYQLSPVFETRVDGLEIDAIQVFVRDPFRDVRTASLPWTIS